MKTLRTLWSDESGLVMSAEAVTLGTVAVLGATAAVSTTSEAINEELIDIARAIRSFDQSYSTREYKTDRGWSAGSSYHQEDVEESLRALEFHGDSDVPAVPERESVAPSGSLDEAQGALPIESLNRA